MDPIVFIISVLSGVTANGISTIGAAIFKKIRGWRKRHGKPAVKSDAPKLLLKDIDEKGLLDLTGELSKDFPDFRAGLSDSIDKLSEKFSDFKAGIRGILEEIRSDVKEIKPIITETGSDVKEVKETLNIVKDNVKAIVARLFDDASDNPKRLSENPMKNVKTKTYKPPSNTAAVPPVLKPADIIEAMEREKRANTVYKSELAKYKAVKTLVSDSDFITRCEAIGGKFSNAANEVKRRLDSLNERLPEYLSLVQDCDVDTLEKKIESKQCEETQELVLAVIKYVEEKEEEIWKEHGPKKEDKPPVIEGNDGHTNKGVVYYTFGSYPQGANGKDEPILWRQLKDYGDGTALLISERILDCVPYHRESKEVSWANSDIRSWLNGSRGETEWRNDLPAKFYPEKPFYDTAFSGLSPQERKVLIVAPENAGNVAKGTNDGNNSLAIDDYVFLLNPTEVEGCAALGSTNYDSKRRAVITPWLLARKRRGDSPIWVYGLKDNCAPEKDNDDERGYLSIDGGGFLTFKGKATNGCSWWWLRQSGSGASSSAPYVLNGGDIADAYYLDVDGDDCGVRPCVRVRLKP